MHHFAIANAAEAVRALRANFPEFERAILSVADRYRVIVGRKRLGEAIELHEPSGEAEVIRIIPIVQGAKRNGVGQFILGAVLLVAGVVIAAYGVVTGNPFLVDVGYSIGNIGLAMMIGGVIQMLSPQPKLPAGQNEADKKNSAVFSGPVNTTAQGNPVPVGYGRLVVGSAVISAGLTTREFAG